MPIRNGTFSTQRGTAGRVLVVVRALVLVSEIRALLSKCPSHTKLCQERSGTVNLRIPSLA